MKMKKRNFLFFALVVILLSPWGQRVSFITATKTWQVWSHSQLAHSLYGGGVCQNAQESCSAFAIRRAIEEPFTRPTFVGSNPLFFGLAAQRSWLQDPKKDDDVLCNCGVGSVKKGRNWPGKKEKKKKGKIA